jgi:predicted choloylglycine hydrolase
MFPVFRGSPREIGVQQGTYYRDLIHEATVRVTKAATFMAAKPWYLPTPLFYHLAKRRASKLLRDDVYKYYPEMAEQLEGMVEGAGVDLSTALFFMYLELAGVGETRFSVDACTAVGFQREATECGETVMVKNMDFYNDYAFMLTARKTVPDDGYSVFGNTAASFPGMIDGMNEQGLSVIYNFASTTLKPTHYAPLSLAIQETLQSCETTEEAVRHITQAKRGGDALLMIGDAEGTLRTVEISSTESAVRQPQGPVLVNTNHYHTEEMKRIEVPLDAVYPDDAAPDLRGTPVFLASTTRWDRVNELLAEGGSFSEERIHGMMSDHGADAEPSRLTICRHDGLASTLYTVVYYPERRTMKVLYGNPCMNMLSEMVFGGTG